MPADLGAISRLLVSARHRQLSFAHEELPALVATAPVMLIAAGDAIWGAAIASWPLEGTAWLRGLALADGLPLDGGLQALLPPFHALARTRGISRLFHASDMSSDSWLQPRLTAHGYTHETLVITYAKSTMDIPSAGAQDVRVRAAAQVDLADILAVDRACFEPQWTKDESALAPALAETPYFVVAEREGATVGYAFATSYFEGRQLHLVRIAVVPGERGRGIGVRLLAEVVAVARARRANLLTLNTQEYNTRARRLYEWFGFRRTGDRQTILRRDL